MLGSVRCSEFDQGDAELLAAVTGLSVSTVRRRIGTTHGNSLIRTVFSNEWPTTAEALGRLTVATARAAQLWAELAGVTGLGTRAVKNRLEREHGKMLVSNAFRELAPARRQARPVVAAPPDNRDGPRPPHSKKADANRVAPPAPPAAGSPARAAGTHPRSGDIVDGRYQLGKYLGGGGFGAAYEAQSVVAPFQRVVNKFANPGNPRATKLLADEIEVAFALKHQNIVAYLDRRVDPRLGDHLVLQHGGSSLSALLEQRRGVAFALDVVEQVAAGLDYAHGKNVLHQDVKPANILVDESDGRLEVRLGDFGISQRGRSGLNTGGVQTVLGTEPIAYTLAYASPEQLDGRPARRTSDQYSLARVLCALLEGRELTAGYQVPGAFPGLSASQEAALRRALSEDSKDRFAKCSDFAAVLRQGQTSSWTSVFNSFLR